MRVPLMTLIQCILISLPSARAAEPPVKPRDEKEGIRKGLAYVEGKSLNWLRQRKCASCHHVPMMVWVQRDARQRGFSIDEKGLKEASDFLLAPDNRARIVPEPGGPPRPDHSYELIGVYTALAFRDGGKAPDPAAQETMMKSAAHVLSRQQADGSWKQFGGRPPIVEYQEGATLFAELGFGPMPKEGDKTLPNRTKARQWLSANSKGESQQTLSLRILIGHERKASVEQLLKRQNTDGGWSQTKEMASDAYATGQTVYALVSRGGIDRSAPAVIKAREFLLKSQKPDGSWLMTSRLPIAHVTKDGAGNLEPITVAAAAWAVLGLLQCTPAAAP